MLVGKSIVLRAVEKDDVETIKEWLADPELLHALGARPIPLGAIDPEKLPEQFRLRDGRILAVASKDKHLLGLVALGNIHEHNRTASIMVLIGDRGEWNRGYGSDALRTAVRFAFEDLNLNCVEAQIPRFNTRGQRVFEKVGFVVEGTLRNRFYGRGRYWDVLVASALRDGWTGERPAQAAVPSAAPAPAQPPPAAVAATPASYPTWSPTATPPPGSAPAGPATGGQGYAPAPPAPEERGAPQGAAAAGAAAGEGTYPPGGPAPPTPEQPR
jgi:RimJ/RimL family protein N-acetyltransferase